MENNNRQGCRWTKASERLPEKNGYYFIKSNYGQMCCYYSSDVGIFNHHWNDEFDNVVWLDESIEPCATSSRIAELENGIKNFIEWLKEKRPTITGTGAPKLILESFLEGRETFATPFPTGDRDCEELKKEVERLQDVEIELEKKTKSSKEWCDKAMEAARHRQELQSRISELEKGLEVIIESWNNGRPSEIRSKAKQLLNKHP
jgi:hypothetical protein